VIDIHRFFAIALGLLAGFFAFDLWLRPLGDPDLFFALALKSQYDLTGRWPSVDPFVVNGSTLVSQHQWLSHWAWGTVFERWGVAGPILLKSVILLFLLGLVFFVPRMHQRRSAPWHITAASLILLLLFCAHHRFVERAALWSELGLAWSVTGVLFWRHKKWFWWTLPAVFFLWAQLHPGFLLAWLVLLALILFDADNTPPKTLLPRSTKLKWLTSAGLVTLLSPLDWTPLFYAIQFSQSHAGELRTQVVEWLPLWSPQIRSHLFLFVPTLVLLPLLVWTARGRWALLTLSLLLTALAWSSNRFVMTQTVVLTILILATLADKKPSYVLSYTLSGLAVGLTALKLWHSPTLALPLADRFKFNASFVPSVAARELKAQLPKEFSVLNSFVYGGYLAHVFNGEPKFFFHGFSTDFRLLDEVLAASAKGPEALRPILDTWNVGAILVSKGPQDQDLARSALQLTDWVLVFEDQNSWLLTRRRPSP
jgi:hypothetical protein